MRTDPIEEQTRRPTSPDPTPSETPLTEADVRRIVREELNVATRAAIARYAGQRGRLAATNVKNLLGASETPLPASETPPK